MDNKKIVGICPAAGRGTRLGHLPCSKELIPVGLHANNVDGRTIYSPKAISHYMVESMMLAGASNIFIIIGEGKSDIVKYYGSGHRFGVEIVYLYQEQLSGMPFALDMPYHLLDQNTDTLFGMPDTLVEPSTVFVDLLVAHRKYGDDVTLGLFKANNPQKFGMVDVVGRDIVSIIDKPKQTTLTYLWGTAVWNNKFSLCLHQYIQKKKKEHHSTEVVLGDVFSYAISEGLKVRGEKFDNGSYWDIGTADDLSSTIRYIHGKQSI